MLRKIAYNKIFRTSLMLMLFLFLLLFPASKEYSLEDNTYTKKVSSSFDNKVYLLDKNNYVSKCKIDFLKESNVEYAKKVLELLIIDGKYESKIPTGFKPVLPSSTIINNVKIENNIIYVDISKDFYELDMQNEEKAIELIVYNMTLINNIKYVYIYIDGKQLDYLPKNKLMITQPLTREYGVNKEYEKTDYKNINKTTIYYVGKSLNDYYYIPVTKINNSNKEKIEIIINELTSSNTYDENLMSFLNYNTRLKDYNVSGDVLTLYFNEYLFDDIKDEKVLEEVIYSICLSIKDNMDVKQVVFNVNNKEILKSELKDIE